MARFGLWLPDSVWGKDVQTNVIYHYISIYIYIYSIMILQVAIFHKCNGGIYNDLLPSRQAAAGEVQPYWLQCDAFVFDAPGFLKKNASILWQSLKGMHYGLLWPGILQKRERERER